MKSIFKKIFLIISTLTTILTITIVTIFNYYWEKNDLEDLSRLIPQGNTIIYDSNHKMIVNLSETYNAYAAYEEIPQVLIDAIIAIEDSRFFMHQGIDLKGILRAIVANLKKNGYSQGASTITQQLIKNLYLSNEKTFERKINEAILALKLEQMISKEDIIASYLSNILFGGKIYGIKMASLYYFNKELKEIGLKEAALLAGLVQMPNAYNPFVNYDKAVNRRNLVLKRMKELGYINDYQYQETINIDLNTYLEKGEINQNIGIYSSYIDYVITFLINSEYHINNSNTKIFIPVNYEIQKFVYEIMQNEYNTFPNDEMQAGIVVIDNKTSEIVAIGGSREKGLRNLNYATDVYNQPGSTIKPLLSYAPAIEYLNYVPLTQILDNPYYYPDGQLVNNWDHLYKGYISLREALSDSRNVPAIKLYKSVGDELAWQFAESLGIKNKDGFYHDSMAIGGMTYGYSVLEMTNAYSSFPKGGIYQKATAIKELEIDNEKIDMTNPSKQVMSEETAFLINNILHDVLKNSSFDVTNAYLSAKTGQSNYDEKTIKKYQLPYNATKDSWVIGYTKNYTVGVWCGFGKISENNYLNRYTKNIPISIMKMILEKFSNGIEKYPTPKGLSYLTVDIKDGKIYEYTTENNQVFSDYFYNGYTPLKKNNNYDEI